MESKTKVRNGCVFVELCRVCGGSGSYKGKTCNYCKGAGYRSGKYD